MGRDLPPSRPVWSGSNSSSRIPFGSQRASGFDSLQPRRGNAPLRRQFHKGRERADVRSVLFAAALIGAAVLCADQGLRRTFALGDVHHVEAVLLNHVMQMTAAVLAHASLFDGASPNHSATSAFTFGLMMWSIHL